MGKVRLCRGLSKEAVGAIASETLHSRGIDPAKLRPLVGTVMPDGTIYAGDSPDAGNAMYTTPADVARMMDFNEAAACASNLNVHCHNDWRVPTKAELNVLFNNRAAIGGFDSSADGLYWSATPSIAKGMGWEQRFRDGYQNINYTDVRARIRSVR